MFHPKDVMFSLIFGKYEYALLFIFQLIIFLSNSIFSEGIFFWPKFSTKSIKPSLVIFELTGTASLQELTISKFFKGMFKIKLVDFKLIGNFLNSLSKVSINNSSSIISDSWKQFLVKKLFL